MNRTSKRLWAGLFVLVVFGGGMAAGFAVRPWIDPDPPRGFGFRGQPPRPPGRGFERLLDRLDAKADLTDDQRQRLRTVFEARRVRLRGISAGVRERFRAERAQMNAQIAAILTAEQMQIFETLRPNRRGRFGPRGPDGGRPSDGPDRAPE